MLIDTHAHLDYFSEDRLKEILQNAKKHRVKLIITNSINIKSCKKNLEISKKYSKIKLAVGLYPEEKIIKKELKDFKKFVNKNKKEIFAIGEIGMDFKYSKNKKLQEKVFKEQLKIAQDLNVPAIIHTREAEKEIIEILKNYKGKKILHCFHGSFKLIKKAVEIGCYFSIPTNVVNSEHFQKMIEIIPKDKILTETDTPYLSPYKNKKNEPAFIFESIKIISKIWRKSKPETEKQIQENFERIFT
ncbi:MAG: TatD family hydrolase [Nanoarchaeota archaeon]